LRAALKSFAQRGYAATSVQDIVDAAHVSKPVLYYYFQHKAGLYQALVSQAHDERYRLIKEAIETEATVAERLTEIAATVFDYSLKNRELMRLAFVTTLAASGEAPGAGLCREKGKRNFDLVRDLMRTGQSNGEFSSDFTPEELTMGIYGQLNSHILVKLLVPECPLNRESATRIVKLFLKGAGGQPAFADSRRNGSPKKIAGSKSRISALPNLLQKEYNA